MMTLDEHAAAIRAANPFFTVSEGSAHYNVYPDELPEVYEAMVMDRAQMALAAETQAVVEDARRTLRRQVRLAKALLAEPATTANAIAKLNQTREILARLIDVLVDRAIIEREEE